MMGVGVRPNSCMVFRMKCCRAMGIVAYPFPVRPSVLNTPRQHTANALLPALLAPAMSNAYVVQAARKADSDAKSADDVQTLARTLDEFLGQSIHWKPEDDLVEIRRILCKLTVRISCTSGFFYL